MSEQNDDTQPVDATTVRDQTAPGWRERAYGLKGVAAVAVAGVIIGGGAGAAIHAATVDDGGRDGRPGFRRDGGPGGFGGPGGPGGPRGPRGQMPGQPPGQGGPGQGQPPQPPDGQPS